MSTPSSHRRKRSPPRFDSDYGYTPGSNKKFKGRFGPVPRRRWDTDDTDEDEDDDDASDTEELTGDDEDEPDPKDEKTGFCKNCGSDTADLKMDVGSLRLVYNIVVNFPLTMKEDTAQEMLKCYDNVMKDHILKKVPQVSGYMFRLERGLEKKRLHIQGVLFCNNPIRTASDDKGYKRFNAVISGLGFNYYTHFSAVPLSRGDNGIQAAVTYVFKDKTRVDQLWYDGGDTFGVKPSVA